jgi:hypothetical protein
MSYNYKNYEKIIVILFAIAGLLGLILYFNLFSFKEGFTNDGSFVPWPKDLVKRFKIYQATVGENNYKYNMSILQQQATASEAEEFLKTGHWTWSNKVKQQYMEAISMHPMIKVDMGEALNSATKIYTEPAIKQVLLFNTTEGEFLLNGLQTGSNVSDTIKCSTDFNNSVLEKTVFHRYNLRNGYKNTTTTTIQNEDIPSEIKGFRFLNGPCNPCAAVNTCPDYSCKFKLDIPLNTFRDAFL